MLVRTLAASGLVLLGLQLVRPGLPSGPATAELQAPSAVKTIFRTSCYPCHSNERRLSWFDEVAPAYWLVSRDIKLARKHLNFSELGGQSEEKQRAALFQAVNFVQDELNAAPVVYEGSSQVGCELRAARYPAELLASDGAGECIRKRSRICGHGVPQLGQRVGQKQRKVRDSRMELLLCRSTKIGQS